VTTENNSSLQKSGPEFETLLSSCNQLHFWRDWQKKPLRNPFSNLLKANICWYCYTASKHAPRKKSDFRSLDFVVNPQNIGIFTSPR